MDDFDQGQIPLWRLAAVEETAEEAIITTDSAGTLVAWSPGAERLYSYTPDEAIGRPFSFLVPDGGVAEADAHLADLRRGQQVAPFETTRRARGAEIEVVSRMGAIRGPSGDYVGAVIIDRDLTEQRSVAAMLDTTLARLQSDIAKARDAESTGRRFLADAAHQLRSPITGIRVCAEALLGGPEDVERGRLLTDLVSQTARAARLLSSLLRVARLDEGEELQYRLADVVELVREVADRIWHLAPHLDMVVRTKELTAPTMAVDPAALQEIVANLLENATRHASLTIEVTLAPTGEGLEIRVRDDGPGLPSGGEERSFERFVSLDDQGGSGLGLPIARRLARAHGGDLTYEDRTFVVRLRAEPSQVSAGASSVNDQSEPPA